MTGMSASISRTRPISVMPSMPGMRISVTTTPLKPWVMKSRAPSALAKSRTAKPARSADCAVESLDDIVGNREAKAETLADAFGGEKRIEDAFGDCGRYAGALVSHADGD